MNASTIHIPTANTRMMVNMLLKFDVDTPKWSRLKGVSFSCRHHLGARIFGFFQGVTIFRIWQVMWSKVIEHGPCSPGQWIKRSSQERFQVPVNWSILFWRFNMDERSHTEVVSEVFPVLDWRCLTFPVLSLFWKYTVPQKFNMDPENWPS